MVMLNKRVYSAILLVILLLLGGCSTSQEDLAYYQTEFVKKTKTAFEALENSSKVLQDVRTEADKGMKRTKIMNAIDQGRTALQAMHDDLFNSPVPKEMEQVKETILRGINKKIEAHGELFTFYDLQDRQFEQKSEQLLKESDALITQAKSQMKKFMK
jgi:uncharacterized lipoprotein YmbA